MFNTKNNCVVAMVLNALEVDPKRKWKGNWRWFSGNNTTKKKESMDIN